MTATAKLFIGQMLKDNIHRIQEKNIGMVDFSILMHIMSELDVDTGWASIRQIDIARRSDMPDAHVARAIKKLIDARLICPCLGGFVFDPGFLCIGDERRAKALWFQAADWYAHEQEIKAAAHVSGNLKALRDARAAEWRAIANTMKEAA